MTEIPFIDEFYSKIPNYSLIDSEYHNYFDYYQSLDEFSDKIISFKLCLNQIRDQPQLNDQIPIKSELDLFFSLLKDLEHSLSQVSLQISENFEKTKTKQKLVEEEIDQIKNLTKESKTENPINQVGLEIQQEQIESEFQDNQLKMLEFNQEFVQKELLEMHSQLNKLLQLLENMTKQLKHQNSTNLSQTKKFSNNNPTKNSIQESQTEVQRKTTQNNQIIPDNNFNNLQVFIELQDQSAAEEIAKIFPQQKNLKILYFNQQVGLSIDDFQKEGWLSQSYQKTDVNCLIEEILLTDQTHLIFIIFTNKYQQKLEVDLKLGQHLFIFWNTKGLQNKNSLQQLCSKINGNDIWVNGTQKFNRVRMGDIEGLNQFFQQVITQMKTSKITKEQIDGTDEYYKFQQSCNAQIKSIKSQSQNIESQALKDLDRISSTQQAKSNDQQKIKLQFQLQKIQGDIYQMERKIELSKYNQQEIESQIDELKQLKSSDSQKHLASNKNDTEKSGPVLNTTSKDLIIIFNLNKISDDLNFVATHLAVFNETVNQYRLIYQNFLSELQKNIKDKDYKMMKIQLDEIYKKENLVFAE